MNASANKGNGFEKGNSQFYTDTEVNAGKQLTLNSGKDTTLTGAQVSGESVKANVGGDLTLSSQQATDKYDSKQQSGSVSGSIGTGLNTTVSLNANKTEMHCDYQSVDRQTGIWTEVRGKIINEGQTNNVVINMSDTKVFAPELQL